MTISVQPAVTTEFSPGEDTRRDFERNGYVKLRGVLDPAVLTAWGPVITDKVIELNTEHLPLEERDTYGKAFLQVSNIWQASEQVAQFAHSRDLARIATELLGVRAVRMYHDQALYKEPGGGITPWHADQYYWPFATDRCVTVWIPLQDTPAELGPPTFAATSHTFEIGRDLPISDESEVRLQAELTAQKFPLDDSAYALGDLSYHLGWTFHRAGANSSERPRQVMTMIYVDADMVITEPTNDNRSHDLNTWMPGMAPGQTVASLLNPVMYQRS